MTVFDLLGIFSGRISGFDSTKLADELCKTARITLINTEGEDIIFTAPFYTAKRIESFCKEKSCVLNIEEQNGLFFTVKKYLKRYGFAIGVIIFIAVSFILSNTVLKVRIIGDLDDESRNEILNILHEEGIYAGAYIPNINFRKTEVRLFEISPQVAWASIGHSGSVVSVNISVVSPKIDSKEGRIPCNIVASHDGQITRADVMVGELKVLIGSPVKKGEILVSGISENANGIAYYQHSIARITAEYQDTVRLEQRLFDYAQTDGETVYKKYFSFFEYDIPLLGSGVPGDYSVVDESYVPIKFFGLTLPLGIKTLEYTERVTKGKIYSVQEAEEILKKKLTTYEDTILSDCEIIDREITTETNENSVVMTVKYTLSGEIGKESPLFAK